ncbi:MAG TPA: GNAT family N-acetyltransferase [Paraburkholderia sp.]|jgi:ribosomal protein S18 acetylase RimI-like enzyme|uniref:GNAT family N-acetyltransferase n=1 Tax=Paraburkholderia sp. TaxID=1926495 RepID=UPI002B46CF67|nr:GNAT family N-acetyltransferase [Paraburkholderia sp.]HKR42400.1 GNAT family N-acetyltransferase [Paraburkholderia sp.]
MSAELLPEPLLLPGANGILKDVTHAQGIDMKSASRHILDTPIWSALTTRHGHLQQGGAFARRYHPEIAPFAAVVSDTATAWHELHGLLQPGEQARLMTLNPVEPVQGLQADQVGMLHQMVAASRAPDSTDGTHDPAVLRLSHLDAQDMLDLATMTKPGPFARRTHETGNYIGIRERGQLIAMAGERMHIDGYVEISAVCVHDEHRGKGFGGRLVNILRREIEARGDTAFLHVRSDNQAAIGLYERLGFELRQAFHLIRIRLNSSEFQARGAEVRDSVAPRVV